jgi:hypothetical protein
MKRSLTLNVSAQEAFAIQKFCERRGLPPLAVLLNTCGHQNPEPFLLDIEPLVEKRLLPTKIDDPRLTDPTVRPSKKLELKRQLSEEAFWSEIDNRQPLPCRRGGQNVSAGLKMR